MPAPTVAIRRLTPDELPGVVAIDVRETDDVILVQAGESITERHEPWSRRTRDAGAWAAHVAVWRTTLDAGGAAWGALVDGRLVGLIVLRRRVLPSTDQLQALFVDRGVRRQGIASRLIATLQTEARTGGATVLVVSATPSRSAVGTYLRSGFHPAAHPVPELLALEPEDIHLEKPL